MIRRRTVAALHAHPDDEALLTGGTLAALAALGHRVLVITATRGEAGLSDGRDGALDATRVAELQASAAILGCDEVIVLDHRDSGMAGENPDGFAHLPVEDPGEELVALLRDQHVDVLIGYDANGGYGHPDHRQVHHVARHAAARLPGLRLLEATVDRLALARAMRLVSRLPFVTPSWDEHALREAFAHPDEIAATVDVRAYAAIKQRAMAAHASQLVGGHGDRTLRVLTRVPRPLVGRVLGTEWFVDPSGLGIVDLGLRTLER